MFSSKLKEENVRIRAARASGREETLDVAMQENTLDDDEGSIVTELKKGHNSCGACRTRESETWWKAPKGLPTNVLCDHCGLSWRKYADLNVRPIREEPVPKAKAGDKREGTPLNGPTTKRAKVSVDAPDPRLQKPAAHHVAPSTQTASSQSTPPPPKSGPFLYIFPGALTQVQGQVPPDAFDLDNASRSSHSPEQVAA